MIKRCLRESAETGPKVVPFEPSKTKYVFFGSDPARPERLLIGEAADLHLCSIWMRKKALTDKIEY